MALAQSTGLRPGSTMTAGPNLRRSVRPAAYDMATIGSRVRPLARSLTQSES